MQFRRATLADVPAIVTLVESAYRGDSSRVGWTTEADLLEGQRTDADDVARLVDGPSTRIVLAQGGDGLVGSVLLRDEGSSVYIGMFAVRPGGQGRGVGSALLAEVERVSRQELHRNEARMTVLVQRTELIAWYERRGYQRTGEHEPFPYDDPRMGVPRRTDLRFEILRKTLV
jgi:ribosomal protein S18 acetylase RimI-like enzyme